MDNDLISRQAAIDFIKAHSYPVRYDRTGIEQGMTITGIEQALNEVLIVQPKQKTGRWIYKERNILINTGRVSYGENGAVQEKRWAKVKKPYCSECGWYENSEYEATPYCPNCGAKMKSEVTE